MIVARDADHPEFIAIHEEKPLLTDEFHRAERGIERAVFGLENEA